jgi:hypothetical protein
VRLYTQAKLKIMKSKSRSLESILFLVVVIGIYSVLMLGKFLHYPPSGLHIWAQSDRASIAFTYYQEGNSFFLPQTFNVHNENGIVGVEFPIVYYFISLLYNIFGYNPFLFRLTTFAISLIGLLYAFKTLRLLRLNLYLSLLIPTILLCSPIYAYYSISFLPDSHALGFFFIGFYFGMKRSTEGDDGTPWLPCFFFTIAALIKITYGLYLVGFLATELFKFNSKDILTKKFGQFAFVGLLCFSSILGWYLYARWVNEHYQSGVFLMGIRPSMGLLDYLSVMKKAISFWGRDFLSIPLLTALLLVIVIVLYRYKSVANFFAVFLIVCALQLVLITYLFATQFIPHDYYFFIFFPFVFVTLATFFQIVPADRTNIDFALCLTVLIVLSLAETRAKIPARHDDFSYYNAGNTDEKILRLPETVYRSVDSVLQNKRVIVVYDFTMNVSLYKLKSFGVPVHYAADKAIILNYLRRTDLEYILFYDSSYVARDIFQPFLGTCVYSHENLTVFKVRR